MPNVTTPNDAKLKGDYLNLATCGGLLAVYKVRKKFEMVLVVQKCGYARARLSLQYYYTS